MKTKIKEGDNVIVISGKNKGQEGVVTKIDYDKNQVIVDGLNYIKVHVKPSQNDNKGGIQEQEGPIHISNVMVKEGKIASRIKYSMKKDGTKKRVLRKNNMELKK